MHDEQKQKQLLLEHKMSEMRHFEIKGMWYLNESGKFEFCSKNSRRKLMKSVDQTYVAFQSANVGEDNDFLLNFECLLRR